MTIPSYEQIIALAPDESSAKSGRELANARKWVTLGCSEDAVWGECQGSGANPYQTRISILDNTFKCTCPSRKFPCKHGLGLYLLLSKEVGAFTQKEPPAWVAEWLATRDAKQQKKAKKEEEGPTQVDTVAQAKRAADRNARVKGGAEDLDRWLQDLIRRGLASVQNETYGYWEAQAKRLVDCQAPGLSRMLRQCAGTAASGEGWQDKLLRQVAQIYLLIQAYERIDELPPELKSDVRTAMGFTTEQDEVLTLNATSDTWLVLAQRVEQEERLRVQRTWLAGKNSGKRALVLSFAHGTAPLDSSLLAGFTVEADLVYYPSAYPLRALLKRKGSEKPKIESLLGYANLAAAMEAYSTALATSPWIERFPVALEQVVPVKIDDKRWSVRDVENKVAPLSVSSMVGWQLMSVSAGHPISVFGEWNGESIAPLSILAQDNFYRV